jgi:hypothetical protein
MWATRRPIFAPGGRAMNGIAEAVDYRSFFEETVLQLFACNNKRAMANEQLADTREKLSQSQLDSDEYRAYMQVILIGGGVVVVVLVLVVVFIAARQGSRSA